MRYLNTGLQYFGLYGSDLYRGYTEKTDRKVKFYKGLTEYRFVAVYPVLLKSGGFGVLMTLLEGAGLEVT